MSKCTCKGFYQPVDCPVHGKPPEQQFKQQYLGEFSHDPIFRTIKKLANIKIRDKKNYQSSNILFTMHETMKRNPDTELVLFEGIMAICSHADDLFDMVVKNQKELIIKIEKKIDGGL